MNIVYLVPSLENTGGMERILTEKINYLSKLKNVNIHVITTEQYNNEFGFAIDNQINIVHFKLNFTSLYKVSLVKKYINTKKKLSVYKNRLKKYIIENNIDLCISLGGKEIEFLGNVNWPCKKILEIHFSKYIRKQFLLARKRGIFWSLLGDYRSKQLEFQVKGFDKLVVLTRLDLEDWKRINSNVVQIYNFSPFEKLLQSKLINKRIITVGRLEPQKGYDLLIKAFSKLDNIEFNNWTIHIFGEGEDRKYLENLIYKYNLDKVIFLEGVSKDIQKEMYNSSIYLMTSRYEGFPMVLLEALSVGLPIVSYDCPTGPREIIENNDCGFLIEFGDENELLRKLKELMLNENQRIKKGETSFKKNEIFDKEKIMKKWINLFDEVVNK